MHHWWDRFVVDAQPMVHDRRANPIEEAVVVSPRSSRDDGEESRPLPAAGAKPTSLIIMGDEVTLFPSLSHAEKVSDEHADALRREGWRDADQDPNKKSNAIDFVVSSMRSKNPSPTSKLVFKMLGKDAPILLPEKNVVVHDISGEQRRSCDFYICVQMPGSGSYRAPTDKAIDAAKRWSGTVGKVSLQKVALPDPPWQLAAQIDAIWYRRDAVEGLGGRYAHPYSPSVALYRSQRQPGGWRIALPDGCIVDERGYVSP
jgi:hypothetical protein